MGKYMLLKEAAKKEEIPAYRLRMLCIEKKIRFVMAGNRYVINLDWLQEDLEKMALENIEQQQEPQKALRMIK